MRARLVIALAAFLAACNALTGLDDEFRLATTAGAEAGTPDPAEAAAPDVDARAPGDDARAPDAGDAGTCAAFTAPGTFCTDFEDTAVGPPAFGWDPSGGERNGGDIAVEPGVGVGGSRGLRARATADGGASLKVSLWKTLPGPTNMRMDELELRFAFRIASSTMDYAALATFAFPQTNNLLTFGLGWYGDHLDTSSPPGPKDPTTFAGGVGAWHAGRVTMTRDATSGTYTLQTAVDGAVVDTKPGLSIGAPTSVQIRLGAYFTSVAPATLDVTFDDVVATRK